MNKQWLLLVPIIVIAPFLIIYDYHLIVELMYKLSPHATSEGVTFGAFVLTVMTFAGVILSVMTYKGMFKNK